MIYIFLDYELDTSRYELRHAGTPLHIEPKTFDLLLYLIERYDQVVTKEDLHAHLWPDQFVSDSALTYYIAAARKAVGDSGRAQRVIKTIYGRGYSFVAPLETASVPRSAPIETPAGAEPYEAEIEPAEFEPSQPLQGRRQVTVLWGNIVVTSASSTLLDPEERYEIARHVQTACGDVLRRFDGYHQHLSHGLFGYFGYPQAHEDDAHRAVRAGLEMVRLAPRLSRDIASRRQINLTLRVGIHTGVVVMDASRRDDDRAPLALGNVPHIATELARLGDPNTAPNTVIVSSATLRLVEGYFICQNLGHYFLEALAQSVVAYQVLHASGAQSRIEAALATRLTPFVGRQHEMGLLQARWEQAAIGMGQLVLLSGDAGIGKSRLLHAWSEQLAGAMHTRIECRCSAYTQHSMLYPILDQLQHLLQVERDDTPEEKWSKFETWLDRLGLDRTEFVPLLARWFSLALPERYAPSALSPPQQKQKMFEALLVWLLREAETHPVCFVMEDLHWADPSTLDWIDFLLTHIPTSRLMFLVTFRTGFHSPWSAGGSIAHLTLNHLLPQQVEAMIDEVTEGKKLPSEIIQQLTTQTDGVPLFVEEMTRMVIESGLVKEQDGRYELADTPQPLAIPSTLHDALAARLDRLETGKHTAQLAATIGREFSYELIQAIATVDEATLQQELTQLVDAELLYQRGLPPQAHYLFKHALIQEAAYQSLLRRIRQEHHRRIAQVLEERFPETRDSQPELLAHHYTEAGLSVQAVAYWQQAAQQALERSAHLDVLAHVQQGLVAISALPDGPERHRHELTLQTTLGVALIATKGYAAPEVEQTYLRARELCQQVGDIPHLFTVLRGLWVSYLTRGELSTAYRFAQQLFRIAQQRHDTALLLEAHRALGSTLFFLGELASSWTHVQGGIPLYDAQQHRALTIQYGQDTEAVYLGYSAWNLWMRGYPDQALHTMHQAIQLAQQLTHPYTLGFALTFAAMLSQWRREVQDVQNHVVASIALAQEHMFPLLWAMGTTFQGWAQAQQGDVQAGLEQMQQGIAAYQATGAGLNRTYMLALLAEGYGKAGRVEEGLAAISDALAFVEEKREGWWEAELHRLKGELLLLSPAPDIVQAEAALHQALEVARNQHAKSLELRAAMSLSRLWLQQDQSHQARRLLGDIYGWFTEGHETVDLIDAQMLLTTLT